MLKDILLETPTIVDVRMPFEFQSGHVKGSINIPLNEIDAKFDEIENYRKPLLLICRTGSRSGMAVSYLKSRGVECYNGGGWTDVNFAINNVKVG